MKTIASSETVTDFNEVKDNSEEIKARDLKEIEEERQRIKLEAKNFRKAKFSEKNFFDLHNSEFEQNKANVLLEEYIKSKNREKEEYNNRQKPQGKDMFDDLITAMGNAIEGGIAGVLNHIKEKREQKQRDELITKLEKEAAEFTKGATTVGELEKRLIAVEKVFKSLEKQYTNSPDNRLEERLRVNKRLDACAKLRTQCDSIVDKNQPVFITERASLVSEINRCRQLETSIPINDTNANIQKTFEAANTRLEEQNERATAKMKRIYDTTTEWHKHDNRDTSKYLYREPAYEFKGQGIPIDSETGKAIKEQLQIQKENSIEIDKNKETLKILKTIDPEHNFNFTCKEGQNFNDEILKKVAEINIEKDQTKGQTQEQPHNQPKDTDIHPNTVTSEQLIKHLDGNIGKLKDRSDKLNDEIRKIYDKAAQQEPHKTRDPEKFYYREPAHKFNNQGIPKDSELGQEITKIIEAKTRIETEIEKTQESQKILKTVSPEYRHDIDIKISNSEINRAVKLTQKDMPIITEQEKVKETNNHSH